MTGYLCYAEDGRGHTLVVCPTREQAEALCLGDGVTEIEAGQHVNPPLDRPVWFGPADRSFRELGALLDEAFPLA